MNQSINPDSEKHNSSSAGKYQEQAPELLCQALYIRGMGKEQVLRELIRNGIDESKAKELAEKHAPTADTEIRHRKFSGRLVGVILICAALTPFVFWENPRGTGIGAAVFCAILGFLLVIFPQEL